MLMLQVRAATTNLIAQFGVTWEFSSAHEYGTFANGDFWVVGPVTVTNMTPAWSGTNHGWEINPTWQSGQGFFTNFFYDPALRPAMPFSVTNSSLVKTIGGVTAQSASMIHTAAVLTVVTGIPPTSGATVFRPPYVGTNKPFYLTTSLQSNLLPSYASVASAPTLASVVSNFSKCLRMDHTSGDARVCRPAGAMKDYQPENTAELNESMLRLMLNDSYADKLPALIQFTQHAIDHAHAVYLGYRNPPSGHNPNHRVIAAWGAVMLDITEIKTALASATGFHEDENLYDGLPGALWGVANTENAYWNFIMGLGGSRSNKDPYNYIDGGNLTTGSSEYQFINSQSLKGQTLIYKLFPQLQVCIPAARWLTLSNYSSRWVNHGTWALPDPAAPYDGTPANYGITFGSNGMGGFIAGSGRFPSKHGEATDDGQYKSAFVAEMWGAYAGSSDILPSSGFSGNVIFRGNAGLR